MTNGWVCPRCNAVYAPWVFACQRCTGAHVPAPTVQAPSSQPINWTTMTANGTCICSQPGCPVHDTTGGS